MMKTSRSIRFSNLDLNEKLIRLLKKRRVEHRADEDGVLDYSATDIDLVENELICTIRSQIFPSWQILTCPPDSTEIYRNYMTAHDVPFVEECINGDRWYLIPSKYRPHTWKLTSKNKAPKVLAGH